MFLPKHVPPRVNESLVGYLIRAAEGNQLSGLEALLELFLGAATRPPKRHEIERLASFTRCSVSEIVQLFGFEFRCGGNLACWEIGGEWITKRNFITSRTLACCPDCLREDPYLPGVWELTFYRTCALHQTNLIYQCPRCRKPLRWMRPSVCRCNCGFDLRQAKTQLGNKASWMISQLVEHRLYPEFKLVVPSSLPVHMVERLADLTLDGLFKTIWFLGHCMSEYDTCETGHGRLQPRGDRIDQIIENAFSILSDWPHSMAEHLSERVSRTSIKKSKSLYTNAMGPLANYMSEEMQGHELAFLRNAYEVQIRMIWKRVGRKQAPRFGGNQIELDI